MQGGQTIPPQINAHVHQPLRGRSHVAKGKSMPRPAHSRPFPPQGWNRTPHLRPRASPSWPGEGELRALRRPPLTHLRRRRAIKSSSKGVNRGEPHGVFQRLAFADSQRGFSKGGEREGKNSKGLRWSSPAGVNRLRGFIQGASQGLSWRCELASSRDRLTSHWTGQRHRSRISPSLSFFENGKGGGDESVRREIYLLLAVFSFFLCESAEHVRKGLFPSRMINRTINSGRFL